jgi:small subunit ribosomal protein S7
MARKPIKGSNSKFRSMRKDRVYGSVVVRRFINIMMKDGKYEQASRIFYQAITRALEQRKNGPEGQDPRIAGVALFREILEKVGPTTEVISKRVGGANYQVPVPVRQERRLSLAFRWIIHYARKRSEKTFMLRLANEFLDIIQGRGETIRRLEEMNKMAVSNRAFAYVGK